MDLLSISVLVNAAVPSGKTGLGCQDVGANELKMKSVSDLIQTRDSAKSERSMPELSQGQQLIMAASDGCIPLPTGAGGSAEIKGIRHGRRIHGSWDGQETLQM